MRAGFNNHYLSITVQRINENMSDLIKNSGGVGGSGTSPSENGSNSSTSNICGGNNSDNSALVSLGNTSFGFNFESDGGFNNSSATNSEEGNSEGGESDQGGSGSTIKSKDAVPSRESATIGNSSSGNDNREINSTVLKIPKISSTAHAQTDAPKFEPVKKGGINNETAGDPSVITQQPSLPTRTTVTSSSSVLSTADATVPISSASTAATESTGSATVPQSSSSLQLPKSGTHDHAASIAVANLNSIATAATNSLSDDMNCRDCTPGLKRKADDSVSADDDSGGYNSDDDERGKVSLPQSANASKTLEMMTLASTTTPSNSSVHTNQRSVTSVKRNNTGTDKSDEVGEKDPAASVHTGDGAKKSVSKKKKLDDAKREERNAREKERSFRISKQINELRNLLSSGGVIVPKGTKSSVLTEAANYIRMLQQHQYRSEIDRHQLVQQIQRIGSGALGQQAASAVRHVAAQNGVWSLGNFGGIPPKSAMMYHQSLGAIPEQTSSTNDPEATSSSNLSNSIEESDYRHVFNSCTIAMAIASMGGAFIDCNKLFCQLSNYTKQEVCSMTVFNLTSRQDLQSAFDLISQMLSAPLDPSANTSCVLRGALKNRTDIGLNVKLIKGNDGVAKCFCVTLITNPASPYDTSKPIPATLANTAQLVTSVKDVSQGGLAPAPAYTTG